MLVHAAYTEYVCGVMDCAFHAMYVWELVYRWRCLDNIQLLRIFLFKTTAASACFGGAHVCTACACICVINANEDLGRAN